MSGDEIAVLFISTAIGIWTWLRWYRAAFVKMLIVRNPSRVIFMAAPIACAAILFIVLRLWAANDVRDSSVYLFFYMVMGVAWVGASCRIFEFVGICPRDDTVERQNMAAAFASAGALIAVTSCLAGANVGNGPGWWVVVFSTLLSTIAFFVLWACFEWATDVSESVTVERDNGAGLRLGGFLCGTGIILGRSVTGDWISAGATVRDFIAVGWPALPLAVAGAVAERSFRPYPSRQTASMQASLVLAGVYVGAAIFYVFLWQGPP